MSTQTRRKRSGRVVEVCATCQPHFVENSDIVGVRTTEWWRVKGKCSNCGYESFLRARFSGSDDGESSYSPTSEPEVELQESNPPQADEADKSVAMETVIDYLKHQIRPTKLPIVISIVKPLTTDPLGSWVGVLLVRTNNQRTYGMGRYTVLVVVEGNVKGRRNEKGSATWRCSKFMTAIYDRVIVFYGKSREPGSTWPDSSGNPHKDDYRRLMFAKDVRPEGSMDGVWDEPCMVKDLMTEDKVRECFL